MPAAGRPKSYTQLAMRDYVVERSGEPPLTGGLAGTPWAEANVMRIGRFPWRKDGPEPSTVVRMLHDAEALYLQFRCQDDQIFARKRQTNDEVFRDSCVELFASPLEDAPLYFNLEMNCCGALMLGWGEAREGRRLAEESLAKTIRIRTSEPGLAREPSTDDRRWWLAAAVPFETLSRFTGRHISPRTGTVWRANAYRIYGRDKRQFGCWREVVAPRPDYHRPESFGRLRFK